MKFHTSRDHQFVDPGKASTTTKQRAMNIRCAEIDNHQRTTVSDHSHQLITLTELSAMLSTKYTVFFAKSLQFSKELHLQI